MSGSEAWARLHELFVARLAVRVAALEATLARAGSGDGEACIELARQFHSLAGIGGTFGHHELTALAREGEEQCAIPERVRLHGVVAAIVHFQRSVSSGSSTAPDVR